MTEVAELRWSSRHAIAWNDVKGMKRHAVNFTKADGSLLADPLEAIAPVLRASTDDLEIVGTGFFVTTFGFMLTAKHVADRVDDTSNLIVVHKEFESSAHVLRRVGAVIRHPTVDVALMALEPIKSEHTGENVRPAILKLSTAVPPTGSRVGTWGFPQSHLLPPTQQFGGFSVLLERESSEGVIEVHFPTGRDRVMQPGECFQTSMNTMGGASGGPVINESGEVFAVVSSGFDEHTTFVAPIRDLISAKLIPVGADRTMISIVEYVHKY